MTGVPDSTTAPGLEEERARFRSIRELSNHWAGPARKHRSYYWYLTFEDSPALQSLARECQQAIAFPYYDLTSAHGLHMTLDRIAFEGAMAAEQLAHVEAAARRVCQAIPAFEIAFSVLGGTPGAVGFTATPVQPLQDLRDALRAATLSTYPDAPINRSAFHPHVAIAYASANVPAAEVIQAVEKVNSADMSVTVTISEVRLVLLERRERSYAWDVIYRIPLSGSQRSP